MSVWILGRVSYAFFLSFSIPIVPIPDSSPKTFLFLVAACYCLFIFIYFHYKWIFEIVAPCSRQPRGMVRGERERRRKSQFQHELFFFSFRRMKLSKQNTIINKGNEWKRIQVDWWRDILYKYVCDAVTRIFSRFLSRTWLRTESFEAKNVWEIRFGLCIYCLSTQCAHTHLLMPFAFERAFRTHNP